MTSKKLLLIFSLSIFSLGILYTTQQVSGVTFSTISGKVTDSNNNSIIAKAELVQGNIAYHISSNSTGDYSVTIPNGVYTLKFSDFNQTIPNAPAYYDVEKTVTISNTNTVNIILPVNSWAGTGLRNLNSTLYNGQIQIHVPLNVAGYTGMSGDYVKVTNGAFTFKLLPTPSNFTPIFAGQNMGVNNCVVTVSSKTIAC